MQSALYSVFPTFYFRMLEIVEQDCAAHMLSRGRYYRCFALFVFQIGLCVLCMVRNNPCILYLYFTSALCNLQVLAS